MGRHLLSIFCFISISLSLLAQESRPKIGLVLSGGSAHGLSHIGVLKVLEERGIQVDYITGTSMGSIIGGLYAMGMTADEIEDLALNQDWTELVATDVPLQDIAPSEKAYHNRYPLTLKVKGGAFKLPEGFLNSQKLDLALNDMFVSAYDITHFDNLPIPFRCVAVDIETGEIIVIDSGYLGSAIRASMAIPSVFTPVLYNQRLLVDGGLIRNFPVEEVKDMGADIVIGVFVGSRLEEKENLKTLLDILNQSAFMMGILDSDEQKKMVDILVEPDVKDLPTFGFDKIDVLIREGRIAAASFIDQLDSIAQVQSQYTIADPEPLSSSSNIEIRRTTFPFLTDPFDALSLFKYGDHDLNGTIDLQRIDNGISRMFGTKHFDHINYTLQTDEGGDKSLAIIAKPKKVNTISGAFNFNSSTSTALVLTNESRNIIAKPSVLYTTVRAAQNYGFKADYFYRLGGQKDYMLVFQGKIHRYDQNLFEGEILRQKYAENQANLIGGIGYEPNNDLFLFGAIGVDGYRLNPVGLEQDGFERYGRLDGLVKANITIDRIDRPIFPTRGYRAEFQAEAHLPLADQLQGVIMDDLLIPGDKTYASFQLKATGATGITDGVIVQVGFSAGYKSSPSLVDNFRIGGLEDRDTKSISMLGFNTHQLHLDRYAKATTALRIELLPSISVSGEFSRIIGDRVFVRTDTESDLSIDAWSIGGILGVETPIGPFRIGFGHNTLTSAWNTNFAFGYTFF